MRLNLTGSGLCSESNANILSVYLPWSVSWLFYNGVAVEKLLSWGGTIFTSFCAFLAPLLLALKATTEYNKGSISTWGGFVFSLRTEKIILCMLILLASILVLVSAIISN